MKKILFLVFCVWGCFSAHAQCIMVYNNGKLVGTYDNTHKVVIKGNTSPDSDQTHEVVDLGLSVKWATCNVGAETPYEAGYYFSFGETSPKAVYLSTTDKYCDCPNGDSYCYNESHYTKYNSSDGKTVLDPEDDAATVNWGSSYRMPTQEEFQELVNNCTWVWDDSHKGYLVTGANGNSIFLLASGYRLGSYLSCQGSDGNYRSSSIVANDCNYAYFLDFRSYRYNVDSHDRFFGRSVRPVAEP